MCRLFFWILCTLSIHAADFDYVFVGSSPIPLIEALHRSYNGARVLVVEADTTIGGSWKAIDICGVPHVDMGCHQIGNDPQLRHFLEDYIGCSLVPMNMPLNDKLLSADNGLYFSQGCHELTTALLALVQRSTVTLLLGHKLDSVYLDFDREVAEIKVQDERITTSKIVLTPHSAIQVENFPDLAKASTSKHYHLYLLLDDPTPPRFTYQNSICPGMSRIINVTPFAPALQGTGYQLLAIQTHDGASLEKTDLFLQELKNKAWISPDARLLNSEKYIYEQAHFNIGKINLAHPKAAPFFEVLQTEAIWNIPHHAERWKQNFLPLKGS